MMVRDFPKSVNQPDEMALHHLKFAFLLLFSVDERLELGNRAMGKEISYVPFRTEKEDYLWRYSTIFERIFRKLLFHLTFYRNFRIFLAKW